MCAVLAGTVLTALTVCEAAAADRAPLQRPKSMQASEPAKVEKVDKVEDADQGDLANANPETQSVSADDDGVGVGPDEDLDAPPPRVSRATAIASSSEATLKTQASPRSDKFEHNGLTADLRLGTQGCIGKVCSDGRHSASPGFRLDGFFGGNIKGWVDIGASGGWGTFGSSVEPGTNALDLYGIDSTALQALTQQVGSPLTFDIGTLGVQDAKLRSARVGPSLRVHFIPRGRFAAYVGTGFGYSLFRATYSTSGGKFRLDFHGIDVPVQAGFAVHATKNVAFGLQFDYIWARYGLVTLKHPDQKFTAPLRAVDEMASVAGVEIRKDLPQYWMLGAMIRARI